MNKTNIGWTDYSSNLIKYRDPDGNVVNACIKASEGCRHCYAETLAPRWGRKGKDFTAQNMKRLTPFFDEKEAKVILGSKKITGQKMFLNDMTDWMGKWVPDEIIDQCLAVIALRSDVTFQTLTKHPERMLVYFRDRHTRHLIAAVAAKFSGKYDGATGRCDNSICNAEYPYRNLHLGISAETQDWYDERWGYLGQIPAAVRFVSYEPALGALTAFRGQRRGVGCPDWLILGGESGGGHREMPIKECLTTIDHCRAAGVPVFVKQDSGPRPGMQGRIPNEFFIQEFP